MSKFTIYLSVSVIVVGCGAYKLEQRSVYYSPEQIELFEPKEVQLALSSVPKKIFNALKENGTRVSNDSATGTDLFRILGKNQDPGKGYIITENHERRTKEFRCILFTIKRNSITFSYYELPGMMLSWDSIKTNLVPNNGILRIGGRTKRR